MRKWKNANAKTDMNGSQEITSTNVDGHTVLQILIAMEQKMEKADAHAIMAIAGVLKLNPASWIAKE